MSEAAEEAEFPDLEKGWTNPFAEGTPLHQKFERTISQNKDIVIIIDDMNADRGTGKTIAALQLGEGMDQTEEGLTKEKATMSPEALHEAYTNHPERSALVFDEGEVGASNRQAMSKANQALREVMSMGRVEEKYVIITTPAIEFIDKDLQKLADVWIGMTRKGHGIVHFLERQPYAGKLMTPKKQTIEFSDVAGKTRVRQVYRSLTRSKRKKLSGDEGTNYIPKDEAVAKRRQAVKDAKKEVRDRLVYNFYTHEETDVPYRVVAEVADISEGTVNNILKRMRDD